VVIQEIVALYTAFYQGQPSPLPELSVQYGDFTMWQREWLKGDVLGKQVEYWKKQLGGTLPVLHVPTDFPRPAMQTYRGAKYTFPVPTHLIKRVQELSQQEGATPFMTLMAVFQLLLHRYTGQEDLLIGSPIAGRSKREVESMIGMFVNTLVFRTDLSGNLTFRDLLARVKKVAVEAFAHQDVPFEKLVDELQPERNPSHPILVQVLFILQNAPMGKLELPDMTLQSENVDNKTSKFDLTLSLIEQEDGLLSEWEYNTDLFSEATISRMMEHYLALLEAIVQNLNARITDLPMLTAAEHGQLMAWNETARPYPGDEVTIQRLFEEQVERTPERVAVHFEGEELTYAELNSRANRLARTLQQKGVGPEKLVGICLQRSLEMVVGLLGILKAGGAYVPIDPSYPAERIAYLLEDADVSILLTEASLREMLPTGQAHVICLDSEWATVAAEDDAPVENGADADNLAYMIYTSGSTGNPKGVMIPQRGICNRLLWMKEKIPLGAEHSVLQKTPFSFDISVWEFFWTLMSGARLVIAKPGGHQEANYMVKVIQEQRVTHVHFVPSMLQLLLEEEGVENCSSLQLMMAGGEAVTYELQERFFARFPQTALLDLYGPTECSIDSTSWMCRRGDERQIVPIGHPVANTQTYILDKHLQPVPIGVPGELHISGYGVARGYHKRGDLTNEKFIPNPFSGKAGDRMYKTGDLARFLPDGAIEYLGRIDYQVKIRGFRIELEEIEATLLQHPAISQVVVMAREDVPGVKRLVAYLVGNSQERPAIRELRGHLLDKLPEYMVPSFFVMLDAIPLTPNGKADRKALPAPDLSRPELEQEFVEARDSVEETLAAIWAQVLGVASVGVHDNFFELGGDSILAIQVVNKAKQAGLQITPKLLFEHPNVARLASVAGSAPMIQAEQGVVTGEVPLTPIQQYFFEGNSPEPNHFNQAVLLEVQPELDLAVLEQTIHALLVHHDALRMRFVQAGSQWKQVNAGLGEQSVFVQVDLSRVAAEMQEAALAETTEEIHKSLSLTEGPLVRATYVNFGEDKPGRLLLVIHHLVVDGVSWRILLEDLHVALEQVAGGQAVQLPPKTTSFQHWAERLAAHAQTQAVSEELAYWLNDARRSIYGLPVDNRQGANTEESMLGVTGALTVEETQALLQEVPSIYNTQINEVLLAALTQTFSNWSGASSLLVDLEGHGREALFADVDLSRTVGWFTTVSPVLLTMRKTAGMGDKLKGIKEQLRAVPNRGIGYGLLRYLHEGEVANGALRKMPQAEVLFNYLGQFDHVLPAGSPFAAAKESAGAMRTLRGKRRYLLEIDASITGGALQVRFLYSELVHHRATVERVMNGFLDALRAIITHCKDPNAGGYTPSDFGKAKMNQKDLNKLLGKLSKSGR
jgi:amino acid adenylation domain-containing protein/non-ribosomal peptide synthase protein (TIGR01720 family)